MLEFGLYVTGIATIVAIIGIIYGIRHPSPKKG